MFVMRARIAVIWAVTTALIAGVVGYLAYGAGLATKVATTAGAADGTMPYHYGYGFFPLFGIFPFFGFLFFLLILFLVFRPRRWGRGGPYGMRGYGPGGPGGPGAMEDRLSEWHRKAHSEEETPKA